MMIQKIKPLVLSFLVVMLGGCWGVFLRPAYAWGRPVSSVNGSVRTCDLNVIRPERFKEGGKIVVVPFVPGEAVAANEGSQRLALFIIHGFSESVKYDQRFSVLGNAESDQADFLVKGRLTKVCARREWARWWWRKKQVVAVAGKIVDARTGDIVALYEIEAVGLNEKEGLSEEIGRVLASCWVESDDGDAEAGEKE